MDMYKKYRGRDSVKILYRICRVKIDELVNILDNADRDEALSTRCYRQGELEAYSNIAEEIEKRIHS